MIFKFRDETEKNLIYGRYEITYLKNPRKTEEKIYYHMSDFKQKAKKFYVDSFMKFLRKNSFSCREIKEKEIIF